MSLFNELKRRNVFRVGIAYIVMAWLVMQVADVVLNNITAPPWVFHVLLLFLLVGFPFAVIFAWAFELTPDGIKREHEVDRSQSITPLTGKKLDRVIITVLVVALAYLAFDKLVLSTARDAALIEATRQAVTGQASTKAVEPDHTDRSIAVLPFVNMSDDAGNEYFSDGLSEELLNLMAKIPELKVAARTSSFQFKNRTGDIADIARQLRVANILEGSVRKSGNQVRITVQLIKAADGFHLWSETYDRTLENIFAVQDEIASAVVNALKISLLGDAPVVEAADPGAYALFLQGRYLYAQRSQENYIKSAQAYRQAIDIDPDYAAAWAGLARTTINQAGYGYIDFKSGVDQARDAAERSVSLNPGLAMGWASLARIQATYDWNWGAAEVSIQKALELEPANSDVLAQSASLAGSLGRLEQCLANYQKAVELDPLNQAAIYSLSAAYEQVGRLDEAETTIRRLIDLNPDYSTVHVNLAYNLLRQGNAEQALAEAEKEREAGWRSLLTAMAMHSLGMQAEADAELAAYIESFHEFWAYQIAEIYAWRNEPDEAFRWLDRAYLQRDPGLGSLLNDTSLVNLHGDPRWESLLEKVNLLDAWPAAQAEFKSQSGSR